MPIRGMNPTTIAAFHGKETTANLAAQSPGALLAAQNCLILADGTLRRAPGYNLLFAASQVPGTGPVVAMYDFTRSVDQAQFLLIQRGTSISSSRQTGGAYPAPALLATLSSAAPAQFVSTAIACYLSNGADALRLVDGNGTGALVAYQWGVAQPTATPTLSQSTGTLTLQYGRNYVVCDVATYTDSIGTERISVSAPTPISAYSGPISSQVNVVGGIVPSTDPQVTHHWIFATTDSPQNTSATFFFAAEIANSQTSWADALADTQLDQTRTAPFENYPAPPSGIVTQFQSAEVLISGTQMRLSGGATILLGIPDEAFPLDLFFNVPSGARTISAAYVPNDGSALVLSNGDTWFRYTGYNAATFAEQDRIASPGQAGKWAGCDLPSGYVFLSPSKRLWLWQGGTDEPLEISAAVQTSLPGTLGMDAIDPALISQARLHYFSSGLRHFLLAAVKSTAQATLALDWMQLWGVPSVGGGAVVSTPSGLKVAGAPTLVPTDKFPTDLISSTADLRVNGVPTILLGGQDGAVRMFPPYMAGPQFVVMQTYAFSGAGITGTLALTTVPRPTSPGLFNVIAATGTVNSTAVTLLVPGSYDPNAPTTTAVDAAGTAVQFDNVYSTAYGFDSFGLLVQLADGSYVRLTADPNTGQFCTLYSGVASADAGAIPVPVSGTFTRVADAAIFPPASSSYSACFDGTQPVRSGATMAWMMPIEGEARFYWLDFDIDVAPGDRVAALELGGPEKFVRAWALVLPSPESSPDAAPVELTLKRMPVTRDNPSAFSLRGSLQADGCATGKYLRVSIDMASNPQQPPIPFDVALRKIVLQAAPLYAGAP